MFVIDTNILVYSADPDSELHQRCRAKLDDWRQQTSPWYVTWPICYEFLRICTHPRVFRKPKSSAAAWQFLNALLSSPNAGVLVPTSRHGAVLSEIITEFPDMAGNILHDVHTAVLMREHGIREICTRDTDFHRFPFMNVIDPTA